MAYLPEFVFWVAFIVFGLIIGSFLNVVIYRLPRQESVVFPNSRCPACNSAIKPYDNIPVISYLILGGRCRGCQTSISAVYPIVEIITSILYLMVYLRNGISLSLMADILFVSLIVPLVFIDLEHQLLPNAITYPGFILLVLVRLLVNDPIIDSLPPGRFGLNEAPDWVLTLVGSILGALAGGGTLWIVRELYLRLRGIEGMGLGDVKMMLMVGAFLGWKLTILTIFIASLLGSIVGIIVMVIRGGTMKMKIPFGVFLGPASVISLFLGARFIDWYLGMYR